jgi:hypothetical protein
VSSLVALRRCSMDENIAELFGRFISGQLTSTEFMRCCNKSAHDLDMARSFGDAAYAKLREMATCVIQCLEGGGSEDDLERMATEALGGRQDLPPITRKE